MWKLLRSAVFLNKPWSQVSTLLLRCTPSFLSRLGFSIPPQLLVFNFHRILNFASLRFRTIGNIFGYSQDQRNGVHIYGHSGTSYSSTQKCSTQNSKHLSTKARATRATRHVRPGSSSSKKHCCCCVLLFYYCIR